LPLILDRIRVSAFMLLYIILIRVLRQAISLSSILLEI
jgi:hypothetical protein